ncbi:MAG: carbonic anhydrase [Gammaproteobacteria bacterium AqS3]|nr:carbonic anhydrase [Gammaproteobacteria bacterium AqS3]
MNALETYLNLGGGLSPDFQKRLTADEAVELLKAGYQRFRKGETFKRPRETLLADAGVGQAPYAAVLSCMDSRVPVETLFDADIGDLFAIRIAGNVVNDDIMASLEFAVKYLGAKAILVQGHTDCGAIKGVFAGVEDGHVTGLLERIKPALEKTKAEHGEEATDASLLACTENHVDHILATVRSESSIVADMEKSGDIRMLGAVYNVGTGEVAFR